MFAPQNFKRCPWHARFAITRCIGRIVWSTVKLLDVFVAHAVDERHTVKVKNLKQKQSNEYKSSKIYLLL
ncbi:unnamed protein product [Meloidogyne enterolobii]|uniref:Uncharacterized protein n=1 Tax=Meloidogyne enterolobii TaxID=390850 RepID=A0ACB0Z746_MELEN